MLLLSRPIISPPPPANRPLPPPAPARSPAPPRSAPPFRCSGVLPELPEGGFQALHFLDASANRLAGPIPDSWGQMAMFVEVGTGQVLQYHWQYQLTVPFGSTTEMVRWYHGSIIKLQYH